MVSCEMSTGSRQGMAPHRSAEQASMEWPSLGSPLPAEQKEEGNCDDYIAGLAEQIAHSMLDDEEEEDKQGIFRNTQSDLQQARLAWNAQSTTAALSCYNWDMNRAETLKALSQLSSPLQQRIESEAMEVLYAELVRLKTEEKMRLLAAAQQQSFYHKSFNARQSPVQISNLAPAERQSPVQISNLAPVESFSQSTGSILKPVEQHHSIESLHNQQFHARKQAGANWAAPNLHHRPSSNRGSRQRIGAPVDYPYSCYLQQPINGSGMRAVFLGAPGSRESGGTGVFLPRSRTGNHHNNALESKRKPACSTVLLPSRIVQALNLNVENTLSGPVSSPTINTAARREFPSPDPTWRGDAYNLSRRTDSREEWPSLHHPSCSPLQEVAPDIILPTEWTY